MDNTKCGDFGHCTRMDFARGNVVKAKQIDDVGFYLYINAEGAELKLSYCPFCGTRFD